MSNQIDAILVDDDAWTRHEWQKSFNTAGKNLSVYPSPSTFIRDLKLHDRNTPIFIDYRFKKLHRNGSQIAYLALRRGYRRLFITTHLGRADIQIPDYIEDVTDKNPPYWLLQKPQPLIDLSLTKRREIIAGFSVAEKIRFNKRMDELYEAKYGTSSVLVSPFENHLEEIYQEWERAIYLQKSDEYISKLHKRIF